MSAYFASCPKNQLEMFGIDQISAKVSGTTLKVSPGQYNQGIFVNITGGFGEGERYHITHPVASVNGILRGSFYVTISESTIITCTGGKSGAKFRAVIEYKEEVRCLQNLFVLDPKLTDSFLLLVLAWQGALPCRRRDPYRPRW